jgi:hypothetical protein
MSGSVTPSPSPRRVAAVRANHAKRGPWTEAARERVRAAALRDRPWLHATGPRTPEGKAQAARNGKRRQTGPRSTREVRADLRAVRELLRAIGVACRQAGQA